FDPLLSRRTQAGLWAWSFGAFALLCGVCAWRLWRAGAWTVPVRSGTETGARMEVGALPHRARSENVALPDTARPEVGALPEALPTWFARALWFLLPLCGSVLLLATTNKLCQDVAVIPFLWVLPLSLYLVTFILCFDRPAWYARKCLTVLLIPMLALVCHTLFLESNASLLRQIVVYGGSLFVGCMVCHGEVCRLKPL